VLAGVVGSVVPLTILAVVAFLYTRNLRQQNTHQPQLQQAGTPYKQSTNPTHGHSASSFPLSRYVRFLSGVDAGNLFFFGIFRIPPIHRRSLNVCPTLRDILPHLAIPPARHTPAPRKSEHVDSPVADIVFSLSLHRQHAQIAACVKPSALQHLRVWETDIMIPL
jgi:hypothetical protein